MASRTYVIHFKYHYNPSVSEDIRNQGVTLAPGNYVLLEEEVPEDGTITQIIINIPPGPADKVKFRIMAGNEQIFPSSGWFGFENFTAIIPFRYDVKAGSKIYLEAVNRGQNPHFISITLVIS